MSPLKEGKCLYCLISAQQFRQRNSLKARRFTSSTPVARQYSIRRKLAMLQCAHIGDEDGRVVELQQSFPPLMPLEERDIACRGSSGFSTRGSSRSKKTTFS